MLSLLTAVNMILIAKQALTGEAQVMLTDLVGSSSSMSGGTLSVFAQCRAPQLIFSVQTKYIPLLL